MTGDASAHGVAVTVSMDKEGVSDSIGTVCSVTAGYLLAPSQSWADQENDRLMVFKRRRIRGWRVNHTACRHREDQSKKERSGGRIG
jgi:hypothetical protein